MPVTTRRRQASASAAEERGRSAAVAASAAEEQGRSAAVAASAATPSGSTIREKVIGVGSSGSLPPNPYDGFSSDDENDGYAASHGAPNDSGAARTKKNSDDPGAPPPTPQAKEEMKADSVTGKTSRKLDPSPRRSTTRSGSAAGGDAARAAAAAAAAREAADEDGTARGKPSRASDPAPVVATAADGGNSKPEGGPLASLGSSQQQPPPPPPAAAADFDQKGWMSRVLGLLNRHRVSTLLKKEKKMMKTSQANLGGTLQAPDTERSNRTYLKPILHMPDWSQQSLENTVWRCREEPPPRLVVAGFDKHLKKAQDPRTDPSASRLYDALRHFCGENGIPYTYLGDVGNRITNLFGMSGLPKGHHKLVVGAVLVDVVEESNSMLTRIASECATRNPWSPTDASAAARRNGLTMADSPATVSFPTTQTSPFLLPSQQLSTRGSSSIVDNAATSLVKKPPPGPTPPQQRQLPTPGASTSAQSLPSHLPPSQQKPPPPRPQQPSAHGSHTDAATPTMTKSQRKKARKRNLNTANSSVNVEWYGGGGGGALPLPLPKISLQMSSSPSTTPRKKARLESLPSPPSVLQQRCDNPDDAQSRLTSATSTTNHSSSSLASNGLLYGMGGTQPTFPAGQIELPALMLNDIGIESLNPTRETLIEMQSSDVANERIAASTVLSSRLSSSKTVDEATQSESGELHRRRDSLAQSSQPDQLDATRASQHSADPNIMTDDKTRGNADSNVFFAPDQAELKGVMLEESVNVLDAALSCISARDKSIGQMLKTAEAKLATLRGSKFTLERRVHKLKLTSLRQSSLRRKVSQSLSKSRDSLARLLSSEISEQEIAELVAVEESAKREVISDHKTFESEGSNEAPASENEGNQRIMSTPAPHQEPSQDLRRGEAKQWLSGYIRSSRTLNGKTILVPFHEMQPETLFSFWGDRDFEAKIAGFVPCLHSKTLIRSVLDIACCEMLALDHKFFPDARNRAEALRNTCLDARLLTSTPAEWRWQISNAASSGSQPPRPEIDPSIALCPYELAGVCADPFCAYQHLETRPIGTMLPREYLVLPTPSTNAKKGKSAAAPTLLHDSKAMKSEAGRSLNPGTVGVGTNVDMIRLPELAVDYADVESETESSVEPSFSGHSFKWWNQDTRTQVRTPTYDRPSVNDALRDYGFEVSDDSFSLPSPSDVLSRCAFFGMVVEAIGLALHSGRHDVASSMLAFCNEVVDGWDNINSQASMYLSRVGSKTLSLLKDVQATAFAFDSVLNKSSIRIAAEAQMVTAFSSFVFFLLFEKFRERDSATLHPNVQEWENDLACLSLMFEGFKSPDELVSILEELNHRILSQELRQLLLLFKDTAFAPKIPPEVTNTQLLIELCILPAEEEAKHWLRTSDFDGLVLMKQLLHLRIVCKMVHVILRALEWTIDYVTHIQEEKALKFELGLLQDAFKARFNWLRQVTEWTSAFDLILCPVLAACVSLLATNQLYDKAQGLLLRLLAPQSKGNGVPCHRLFHLSEYLWSQLVQLRMVLPPFSRSTHPSQVPPFELPSPVKDANEYFAKTIHELNVHPHHVCMHGDWSLVRRASQLGSESVHLLKSFQELLLSQHHTLQLRFTLNGVPLKPRRSGTESWGVSAFPQAVFLAGRSLIHLDLTSCGLTSLPFHFGSYFPVLELLHLGMNYLKELPSSISSVQSLVDLNVDSNGLETLPHQFQFPKLRELSLEENKLVSLPDSLRECTELQVLNLRGNELKAYNFASLAAKLPKLHRLSIGSTEEPLMSVNYG